MNKRDLQDFQKFLQLNPEYLKSLNVSQLLGSEDLITRTSLKIESAYNDYQVKKQFPFYYDNGLPPVDYIIGDIVIGFWGMNPAILIKQSLSRDCFRSHILCPGATGTGKTNFNLFFLDQIQKRYYDSKIRFLVFASKKNCEQRNLIINNEPGTAYFLDAETLALNPFYPIQNVNDNLVISDCARLLATELGLMRGGQLYLQTRLKEYLSMQVNKDLKSFTNWISRQRETSFDYKGYRDRMVIRLRSVLDEIENIFCIRGIDDSFFIIENVIIELPCSSSFIMSVVSAIILLRMFRFKAANPDSLQYKNIIVLEDIQGGLRKYE